MRIHLLGGAHVDTMERALEGTRIYASARRWYGVRASARMDFSDDPMYLISHEGISAGDMASPPLSHSPSHHLAAVTPVLGPVPAHRPLLNASHGDRRCY